MPERSDRLLNDYAQQLSASEAAALEQRLVAFNDSTSNQIVVITTPTLGGGDVLALAQQIGQQWGVGQKEYDNGVVVLIKSHSADEDWGDVAIATGYGIEGALPDVFCKRIIDEQMLSPLSEGDYYTAITRALDIIMPVMQGEYSLAQYSRDQDRQAMRAFAVFALAVCVMVALLLWHKKKPPDQWRGGGSGGGVLAVAARWAASAALAAEASVAAVPEVASEPQLSRCSLRSRSLTVFTGLKVSMGTSTNSVIQSAIAPFQSPGNSCDFRVCAPLLFLLIKPVVGST